ncbi:MAG: AI-2E family transporter [Lachnospiraceae bacterium]|nr:AI-2E family transporter [Lachnospiraceae bacterium]
MNYWKDENVRKKIFTGVFLIVFFFVCYNISVIWKWIGKLFGILLPFIIGAAIAFVLNVPMRWIEKGLFRNREKFSGRRWAGVRRALALVLTLVLAILILTLLSYMIIPLLLTTIGQLIKQIPPGIRNITEVVEAQFNNIPMSREIIENFADDWKAILEKMMGVLTDTINGVVEEGINAVSGILSGVFNFLVGFIFSLYILAQKEKLAMQAKMILYALFEKKTADEVASVAALTEKTFASFISGQCTEALILTGMFSISMAVMKLPYALLIGLLIGATSLIPVVGTFIGCVIGALLILLVNPMQALIFIILFIVLQQIEGNLIYPKVVGDSIGLPGIWVLLSVTVGGSLFGVKGIILFIPLVSVVYSLFRKYIYGKLREKNIEDSFDYEERFKTPSEIAGRTLVRKMAEKKDRGERKSSNRTSGRSGNKSSARKKK